MDTMNKSGMLKFIDYAIAKGLVNSNTGGGWKAACNKILENFGPDDDLTSLDVASEVLRYNNRHPGQLSPDSLNQYQKRVLLVMSEFGKYLANPTQYKGASSRPVSNGKPNERKRTSDAKAPVDWPTAASAAEPSHQKHGTTAAATETSLALPFPLRPGYLAQIVIPRDMTKDEASRLCAFISTLAMA